MIELRNVSVAFGPVRALSDIDLLVAESELVALLGPSGSGKSTLLRVVAGLEPPVAGTVVIDGRDVTYEPPQRRGIGFVFQHYAPFPHMTVRENVAFGLRVRRARRELIRRRVDELLAMVGLEKFAERRPHQLSGGQRQRMALARALAIEPRVLLLDEPFAALDAHVRRELRAWLRRLHDELGATTLMVTHDRAEAMELADRIAVLNDGRLEQVGPPGELYDNPQTPFVRDFIGDTTTIGGVVVRPDELELSHTPIDDAAEAMITRIVDLGPEIRVELTLADGAPAEARFARRRFRELDVRSGDVVWVRVAGDALVDQRPAGRTRVSLASGSAAS